jgi:TPP-dependent pyruvate/acetoin dehydrogenase alpha subunit
MGTSQKRAMSIANIAKKAEGYGMAGEFVDGMDVMAVRDATLRAIERARKDGSPTLLEIRAYRYMGHSMSDPGKYRTTEEIKKYQERDPINLFQDSLREAKVFTDKDFEDLVAKATAAVDAAVKFADESPFPDEISEDEGIVLFEFFERFGDKKRLYFVHPAEYIALMKISAQIDKGTSAMFGKNYAERLHETRERIAEGYESDFPELEEEKL